MTLKKILAYLVMFVLVVVALASAASSDLLITSTTNGTSTPRAAPKSSRTYQATGVQTGTGAGAVTVKVEGSNVKSTNNGDWVLLQDIVLVLTTTSTGSGFASTAPWEYVRARVMSISGTGATTSVYMGY